METIPWMIVLHWILLGAGSQADSSLPVPRLSSSIQHDFIIKGEEISLNCSLPKGVESGSPEGPTRIMFFFYCRDQSYLAIGHQYLTNNTFNFRTGHLNSSQIKIICTCKIRETFEGSTLSSESNQLVFSVIDLLPPPVLKLHPSSESPGEGKVLSILCVSSESNNFKRFHFSMDGVKMTSSHKEPVKSSRNSRLLTLNMSVAFPYATNNESLGFACRYEENINGRWVMSPWSETITDEPVWNRDFNLIRNFSRMAYLIILLFPLALYCWKNKSKPEVTYSNTQNVFTPSPPGPTLKSHLRQEEEEEIIYYNSAF